MSFTAAPVTLRLESIASGLHFSGRVGAISIPLDSSKAPAVPLGPTPVQLLMMALGGCTGMDVISILRKKRLDVTHYEVEVTGERRQEHPKIFVKLQVLHRLRGRGLSRESIEDAVTLSREKYCSVSGQIGTTAEISHVIEIAEEP